MIRLVAVLSLLSLLVLVLYVPSANPPERFVRQLRSENDAAAKFWGGATATRMLDRAIRMQDSAAAASPIPAPSAAPVPSGVQDAVSLELATVNQRLFNNPYFRSVDALLLLASYRLSVLLEWLPWAMAFVFASLADGAFVRIVKAREFRQHDPEMFALWSCLAIVTACATVISLVVPVTLPVLAIPGAPVVLGVLSGNALASFHRRA